MRFFLFDIDGTLLHSGGAGMKALAATIAQDFSTPPNMNGVSLAGRTDRAIVGDLFALHGIDDHEENWNRFVDGYLNRLKAGLPATVGKVLPGVKDLLDRVSGDGAALGVLTGNIESGARLKLQHYQLDHFFTFGAFGDHHTDRDDIALDALKMIRREHGDVAAERIWIIGDTPLDVRCAKSIHARSLAVATGSFDREQLAESKPDVLLDSFSDVEAAASVLTA
jgi:phosphoglycolate phosphatase